MTRDTGSRMHPYLARDLILNFGAFVPLGSPQAALFWGSDESRAALLLAATVTLMGAC